MVEISLKHALFYKKYGPDSNPHYGFSLGKSILSLLAFKFGTIGLLYFGAEYHVPILKGKHNLVEKHTLSQPGHFEHPLDLQIFLEKYKGYIQPQYGTNDFKVPIAEDGYPVDMYDPLKERSRVDKQNTHSKNTLDLLTSNIENEMQNGLIRKELGQQLYRQLEEFRKTLNEHDNYQVKQNKR